MNNSSTNTITYKTYTPGDFSFIPRESERKILKDAYDGISRVDGAWTYLARPDVPDQNKDATVTRDPIINKISDEIDKDGKIGHNGETYSWTMRQMECIAKFGWDGYVDKLLYPNRKPAFPYPCACRAAKGLSGWCGVAGGGVPACDH